MVDLCVGWFFCFPNLHCHYDRGCGSSCGSCVALLHIFWGLHCVAKRFIFASMKTMVGWHFEGCV